ncbi:MAG: right-handed parallel beta-helix repeat-containing protein, partial [Fibrobacterota bacterium]
MKFSRGFSLFILFSGLFLPAFPVWIGGELDGASSSRVLDSVNSATLTSGERIIAYENYNNSTSEKIIEAVIDIGSGWGAAQRVDAGTSDSAFAPVLKANSQGYAYLTFIQREGADSVLYISRTDGLSWSAPAAAAGGSGTDVIKADFVFDSTGDMYLAYILVNAGDSSLFVRKYDHSAEAWATSAEQIDYSPGGRVTDLAVDASSDDAVYVLMKQENQFSTERLFVNRYNGASWLASPDSIPVSTPDMIYDIDIAAAGGTKAFAVFRQYYSGYDVIMGSEFNGTAWAAEQQLDNGGAMNAYSPDIEFLSTGAAFLVYRVGDFIYSRSYDGSAWDGSAVTVNINSGKNTGYSPSSIKLSVNGSDLPVLTYALYASDGSNYLYYTEYEADSSSWNDPDSIKGGGASIGSSDLYFDDSENACVSFTEQGTYNKLYSFRKDSYSGPVWYTNNNGGGNGSSPSSPASFVSVFSELEAGDTVKVADSIYLSSSVTLIPGVTYEGGYKPDFSAKDTSGVSVINTSWNDSRAFFNNTGSGSGHYLEIKDFAFININTGSFIYIDYVSGFDSIVVEGCRFSGNSGINIGIGNPDPLVAVRNCVFFDNSGSGTPALALGGEAPYDVEIINNTFVTSSDAVNISTGLDTVIIKNNVFDGGGNGIWSIEGHSHSDYSYNVFEVFSAVLYDGSQSLQVPISTMNSNHGAGNDSGDVRLYNSVSSYYKKALWCVNHPTSIGMDAGDPADDYSAEPSPNGGQINCGAYGGTARATHGLAANSGRVWYVSEGSQVDSLYGNGAQGNPSAFPHWVFTQVSAGDTIKFSGGDYNTSSVFFISGEVYMLGGYNTDFSLRDPEMYSSRISMSGSGTSVIDYNSSSGDCNFTLDGFIIEGGGPAVSIESVTNGNVIVSHNVIRNVQSGSDVAAGIYLSMVSSGVTIKNNLIYKNYNYGICLYESSAGIVNNTIAGNGSTGMSGYGIYYADDLSYSTSVKNNILSGNGMAGMGFSTQIPTSADINYNGFYNNYEDVFMSDISSLNSVSGCLNNSSLNPVYRDTSNGDYHLMSSSECIDAGDPADDYSEEPSPNGSRINLGAYGGTKIAAKTVAADVPVPVPVIEYGFEVTNYDSLVTLRWSPVSGAGQYLIKIDTVSDGMASSYTDTVFNGDTVYFAPTGEYESRHLRYNAMNYFQVAALSQMPQYSAVDSFMTDTASYADSAFYDFYKGELTIKFSETVQLSSFDISKVYFSRRQGDTSGLSAARWELRLDGTDQLVTTSGADSTAIIKLSDSHRQILNDSLARDNYYNARNLIILEHGFALDASSGSMPQTETKIKRIESMFADVEFYGNSGSDSGLLVLDMSVPVSKDPVDIDLSKIGIKLYMGGEVILGNTTTEVIAGAGGPYTVHLRVRDANLGVDEHTIGAGPGAFKRHDNGSLITAAQDSVMFMNSGMVGPPMFVEEYPYGAPAGISFSVAYPDSFSHVKLYRCDSSGISDFRKGKNYNDTAYFDSYLLTDLTSVTESMTYSDNTVSVGDRFFYWAVGRKTSVGISTSGLFFVESKDIVAPVNNLILNASAQDENNVRLTWNPADISDTDADSVMVAFRTDAYPDSLNDPSAVKSSMTALSDGLLDISSLNAKTDYYFAIYVRDNNKNWSGASGDALAMIRTPDLTAPVLPGDVKLYASLSGTGNVDLTWNVDALTGTDVDSVEVWWSTNGYPDSVSENGITKVGRYDLSVTNAVMSWSLEKTDHYFSLFARDSSGNWSAFSDSASSKVKTPDNTAPQNISGLSASILNGDTAVLSWTASLSTDIDSACIRYRTDGSYPSSSSDGTLLSKFQANIFIDTFKLNEKTEYYFAMFTRDSSANWSDTSSGAQAYLFIPDITPPENGIDFSASVSDTDKIIISWDPSLITSSDAKEVLVLMSADSSASIPSDPDAQRLGPYDMSISSDTVTGLSSDSLYYFSAFVRDSSGLYGKKTPGSFDSAKTWNPSGQVVFDKAEYDNASGKVLLRWN